MACNCNKNAMRSTRAYRSKTGNIIRPSVGPRSTPDTETTPTALRGVARPTPNRSIAGESQEKRRVQKIRREAILRSLKK